MVDDVTFESMTCLTQEEFAGWVEKHADEHHRFELLNGRIVMTPPAGWPHGGIGGQVQYLLTSHVVPRKLGRVLDSSQGFDLPSGDTVQPDHTFVSNERWKAAPAPKEGKFLRVVPDLVVETLSRSTASRDRGEKKAIYERNGVREYWLVDGSALNLRVFLLREHRYDRGRTFELDQRFRSTVLPELEFVVQQLFPER